MLISFGTAIGRMSRWLADLDKQAAQCKQLLKFLNRVIAAETVEVFMVRIGRLGLQS